MTIEERQNVRSIANSIRDSFGGKNTISLKEFSRYLGKSRAFVCEAIRGGFLPGEKVAGAFLIPVDSIALWESRLAKTREANT